MDIAHAKKINSLTLYNARKAHSSHAGSKGATRGYLDLGRRRIRKPNQDLVPAVRKRKDTKHEAYRVILEEQFGNTNDSWLASVRVTGRKELAGLRLMRERKAEEEYHQKTVQDLLKGKHFLRFWFRDGKVFEELQDCSLHFARAHPSLSKENVILIAHQILKILMTLEEHCLLYPNLRLWNFFLTSQGIVRLGQLDNCTFLINNTQKTKDDPFRVFSRLMLHLINGDLVDEHSIGISTLSDWRAEITGFLALKKSVKSFRKLRKDFGEAFRPDKKKLQDLRLLEELYLVLSKSKAHPWRFPDLL